MLLSWIERDNGGQDCDSATKPLRWHAPITPIILRTQLCFYGCHWD